MKLKKILPLVGFIGLASTIPSIVACSPSNHDGAILLNQKHTDNPTILSNANEITFAKGQSFNVKFTWKDAKDVGSNDDTAGWCLLAGSYDEQIILGLDKNSVSIKVDNTLLGKEKYEVEEAGEDIIPKCKWNLEDKSVIEISFALADNADPKLSKGYIFINSNTK